MIEYVGLIIVGCLFVLNMAGMCLFHYKHHKQHPESGYWKDDVEFWLFTVLCFIAGVAYLMINAITSVKNFIDDKLKK